MADEQLATQTEERVVVLGNHGLAFKALRRLDGRGLTSLPDPRAVISDTSLWGSEMWTAEEVLRIVIEAIAEGQAPQRILEALKDKYGKMPSMFVVQGWLDRRPDFQAQWERAERVRADLMAEAATEAALECADQLDDEGKIQNAGVSAGKVKANQLMLHAAKLNRKYGDKKSVDVQVHEKPETDEELMARITRLNRQLKAQGVDVIDVETEQDALGMDPLDAGEGSA